MAGMTPSFNDRVYNLWFKIAYNLYTYAINSGVTGLTPPNFNDTVFTLEKKAAYYSATTADLS